MRKKKIVIIVSIILIILIGISLSYFLLNKDNSKEEVKEERQKETILLKDNLNYEINSEVKLLSLVSEDNKVKVLSEDETIDTSNLGEKEVAIKYEVEEQEETKTFKITIVDTQAPIIECKKELTTIAGTEIDLLKDVKITDNSKEEIKASVEGEYDFKKDGTYNLKYVAIDSSNNKTEEEFTLKVNKKQNTTTNTKPSNNSNSDKKNNSTSTKPSTSKPSNPSNENSSSTTITQDKPWEALGMNEYQYYNEPILIGGRVDFPVEKCGSEKACQKVCLDAGDEEIKKEGKGAYNCITMKTASGKYLGEMLSMDKLK